jgi:HAD superfamily hydrolase (TIGR01549 family)
MPTDPPRGAVLFDLDGTLVDTNYQHAIAWYRAFRAHEIVLPVWEIHRRIGMGGDKLLPALIGEERAARDGDSLRTLHGERYAELVGEVSALEGAHGLLVELRRSGLEIVLATSSEPTHIPRYLDLLDAHDLVDAMTTAEDVGESKPAPDVIEVAAERARTRPLALVGDSVWDVEAAARGGLPCLALRTGGYGAEELLEAGAVQVFASLPELTASLGDTALAPGAD